MENDTAKASISSECLKDSGTRRAALYFRERFRRFPINIS